MRVLAAVLLALFGAQLVAGCGDSEVPKAAPAEAYVAALGEFMPEPPGPDEKLPVVFVVPIGESALDLDAQVKVIGAFAEQWDVRFVDDPEAAIDASELDRPDDTDGADSTDGEPDEGANEQTRHLIGIGTVHATPPHTVRVEQYTDATTIDAHRVTLVERAGTWRVQSVEPIEPEVLLGDG